MPIVTRDELSPREIQLHQYEKEMFELQAQQVLSVKQIELELAKLESKLTSLLKIPLTLVKLPVYILFGVAYIVAVARKYEPGENFWRFLK
jgi:hypothetical protein